MTSAVTPTNSAIDMRLPQKRLSWDNLLGTGVSVLLHMAVLVGLIWAPRLAPSAGQLSPESEVISISVISIPAAESEIPDSRPKAAPKPIAQETAPQTTAELAEKIVEEPPKPEKQPSAAEHNVQSAAQPIQAKKAAEIIVTGQSDGEIRYLDEVKYWLEKHKIYPRRARMKAIEGQVSITITFTRQGDIMRQKLTQSSGHDILDQAAFDTISAASPLPAMPLDIKGQDMTLTVPFGFFLAD